MHDALSFLPGYSLRRATNAATAELAGRLAELDVRIADASALILIGDNPGVTASALGRQLDIQRANMVPLLKRLEDAGLIERSPIDGKSQGLELTKGGKAKTSAVRKAVESFERDLMLRVPPEHREHLLPALNALWN